MRTNPLIAAYDRALASLDGIGRFTWLSWQMLLWIWRPPYRIGLVFQQLEFIGVKSTFIIALTGFFTGAVFALQSSFAFNLFGALDLVGPTVVLALTRELGPVLTALMVTGRAGSAMTGEIGTMRVTEQIDALEVMAVNPVQYLVIPRVIASVIMLVLLAALFDFVGTLGAYLVAVYSVGINPQTFVDQTVYQVDAPDIYLGLLKAGAFGLILSTVGCTKGYFTSGGARGVGQAITESVVISSVMILVGDYFLTVLLYNILNLD